LPAPHWRKLSSAAFLMSNPRLRKARPKRKILLGAKPSAASHSPGWRASRCKDVWLYCENPEGIFAQFNPKVSCSAQMAAEKGPPAQTIWPTAKR